MSSLRKNSQQPEREFAPEGLAAPAAGSVLLHAGIVGALALYGIIGGFLHHNMWGSPGAGGAIQVNLVSNALPLPNDQPVNQNVVTTETPSKAPAAPAPKTKEAVDQTAIPISGKQAKQPEKQNVQKTQQHQPVQNNYRAQYGEQSGSSMPRSLPSQGGSGPTSITQGDFGSRFGWYVDGINRKMATSWYKAEVTPSTPRGSRVYLNFSISRAGNPSDVQIERSSGSPTLDRSCQRGVQRVDTFGPLPAAYNQSTLKVSYYCEY